MSATTKSRQASARRDAVVLLILIAAVMLIWNGTAFFGRLPMGDQELGPGLRIASTALTLNVALILFGWRRYIDLQHESALRVEHDRCAVALATTDSVTGLYNRKGFADRASEMCDEAARRDDNLAVISFRIHRFRAVIDQYGYEIGDSLLKAIADSLSDQLGPAAILARLSTDEFAIALAIPSADTSRADETAELVLRTVTGPVQVDDQTIQVGAFAGLSIGAAADARIPDMLRRADMAVDHARSGRVARPVRFDAGMERALIAHSEIEQGIRMGLEHGQFVPYFEPLVDLATGDIVGFEVLARWLHPLSGVVGPDVFIPIAEDSGLISRLSEHVIGEAMREAAQWDPKIKISVNISPFQLADGGLGQRLAGLLVQTGFPAGRLIVELTENSLFADFDLARTIVVNLKSQGIGLALDDFGTGGTSLSNLRALPFDVIKIDRSFLTDMNGKRDGAAVVRAVTTLASALQVPLCVEGIENEASYKAVIRLGCAIGQGWYFGKPMPAEQARDLLATHEARQAPKLRKIING